MKRLSGPRKTASNLSQSIHQQLEMYAIAAGAAGVSMLALARPAEAKIVYTPADRWLPLNQTFYLDLNHDGVNDFRFSLRSNAWSTGFARSLIVGRQSKNAVFGYFYGPYPCAAALPEGISVGPKSPFLLHTAAIMFFSGNGDAGSQWFGFWLNVTKQSYLGLRFIIKGKIHYGWARMGHIRHDKSPRAKLTGYAYETIPNKRIHAGETDDSEDKNIEARHASLTAPTSEPATLGVLAMGVTRLSIWRRKEPTPKGD
jgi:hypothetical protein